MRRRFLDGCTIDWWNTTLTRWVRFTWARPTLVPSPLNVGAIMRHAIRRRWQARSFIAGVLIGLSIITPVFAAAGDADNQWRTLLALGSLVLLFLGLLLEAI